MSNDPIYEFVKGQGWVPVSIPITVPQTEQFGWVKTGHLTTYRMDVIQGVIRHMETRDREPFTNFLRYVHPDVMNWSFRDMFIEYAKTGRDNICAGILGMPCEFCMEGFRRKFVRLQEEARTHCLQPCCADLLVSRLVEVWTS